MKKCVLLLFLTAYITPVFASSLINDMQTCQALLAFMDTKLSAADTTYAKEDVSKMKKGFAAYDEYIQNEIVTPGLLKFNGGDKIKADAMQRQVDQYKQILTKQLGMRYSQNKLFTDQVVAIDNCMKKAAPSSDGAEVLRVAVETLTKAVMQ